MSAQDEYCFVCKRQAEELHHIIHRSSVKALINCKLNHVCLCQECHRGTFGVHGKKGNGLDKLLKLNLQEKLELLFDKECFTKEDVQATLKISDRAADSLCKLMKSDKGMFNRLEIIRTCLGGKLILENEE